jgi:hypothetical protein
MAKVNEALAAMGDDALTGTKLLREVLWHPDTPLDVKIQCAGLVLKQETPTAEQQQYVAHMPPAPTGETQQAQLAVWWALYGEVPVGDPKASGATRRLLRLLRRLVTAASPQRQHRPEHDLAFRS